jgi:hypothetical protein
MVCVGLDFFGLWEQREDGRHWEDFDGWEKFGREMSESAGVEAAGADFGQEVCAEHLASIGQINGAGDMARVAVRGLDGGELCGEFGAEDQGKVFGGLVARGLLD